MDINVLAEPGLGVLAVDAASGLGGYADAGAAADAGGPDGGGPDRGGAAGRSGVRLAQTIGFWIGIAIACLIPALAAYVAVTVLGSLGSGAAGGCGGG
jgi:hypothetical protein